MGFSVIIVVSGEAHPFAPQRRIAVDRLGKPTNGRNAGSRKCSAMRAMTL